MEFFLIGRKPRKPSMATSFAKTLEQMRQEGLIGTASAIVEDVKACCGNRDSRTAIWVAEFTDKAERDTADAAAKHESGSDPSYRPVLIGLGEGHRDLAVVATVDAETLRVFVAQAQQVLAAVDARNPYQLREPSPFQEAPTGTKHCTRCGNPVDPEGTVFYRVSDGAALMPCATCRANVVVTEAGQ